MTYFRTEGRENLDETLRLVKGIAQELGIQNVVLASTTGFTAEKALETFGGLGVTLTVVGTDRSRFSRDLSSRLEDHGHNLCFSREVPHEYPDLVSLAYRRFSQGVKVAVQIAIIAAQKGFVSSDDDVIAIGKWDTALIIKPATSEKFSELKVREIICMPR